MLYAVFFSFAAITSYIVSQFGLTATCTEVVLAVSGVLVWRTRRPQDVTIESNSQRVFICVIWGLIFLGAYLILRATQPANYRLQGLVVLGTVSLLLASYFGSIGKGHWIKDKEARGKTF